MKILLIGEFSGVHNNLKKGLLTLGHDVILAASGDGYRKFEYDIRIAPYSGRFTGRINNILYFMRNIRKFIGHDIVQFINPFSVPYYFILFGLTSIIFKYNKKTVYYACGTDPNFINAKNKFRYFPFDDETSKEYPRYNFLSKFYFKYFMKKIDLIIPSMYTYYKGYEGNKKLVSPIPLPCSYKIGNVKPLANSINILHGITRGNFKGSKFILAALDLIEEKHKEHVSVNTIEGVPIQTYLQHINKADIVIDQCKTYDYGMNAIFAMEHGCIVLSGSEKEAMEYLGFSDCPVINILPDIHDIFQKVEYLIKLSNRQIDELKKNSIAFVGINHSPKKIASKFIKKYIKLIE